MRNDISRLNEPMLGNRVLSLLNQIQALPPSGIVAGQAVASAIDEILGTGKPVYNDIDVFGERKDFRELIKYSDPFQHGPDLRTRLTDTLTYNEFVSMEYDDYADRLAVATRRLYNVQETHQQEMLNLVTISWGYRADKKPCSVLDLVKVFDLNNVQVGVDIQSRTLSYTPAFAEFFRTRQLRPATSFTPVHTLLRAFKKAKEFGDSAYLNADELLATCASVIRLNEGNAYLRRLRREAMVDGRVFLATKEVSRVAAATHSSELAPALQKSAWVKVGEGLYGAPMVFGKKFRTMFEAHAQDLRGHLELTENKRGSLFLAEAGTGEAPLSLPAWPANAQNQEKLDLIARHVLEGYAAEPLLQKIQGHKKRSGLQKQKDLFEQLLGTLNVVFQGGLRRSSLNLGDEFFEGALSEKDLRQLFKDMSDHSEIAQSVGVLGLRKGMELTRRLRKAFAQYRTGDAWGVLARKSKKDLLEMLTNDERLQQLMLNLKGDESPLVAAMPIPNSVEVVGQDGVSHSILVSELLSQGALNREGVRMRNCVAGYGNLVKNQGCRILHLEIPGTELESAHATCEWGIYSRGYSKGMPVQVTARQLLSVRNQAPHVLLKQAQKQLIEGFNQWLKDNREEGWNLLASVEKAVQAGSADQP